MCRISSTPSPTPPPTNERARPGPGAGCVSHRTPNTPNTPNTKGSLRPHAAPRASASRFASSVKRVFRSTEAYLFEVWWLNAGVLLACVTRPRAHADPFGDALKCSVLHVLLVRVRRLRGFQEVRGFDHHCAFVGAPIGADNIADFCIFLSLLTGCLIEECFASDPATALVWVVVDGRPGLAARLFFFMILSMTGAFFTVFQMLSGMYGRQLRVRAVKWTMAHRKEVGLCVVSVSFCIGLAVGKLIVLSLM